MLLNEVKTNPTNAQCSNHRTELKIDY